MSKPIVEMELRSPGWVYKCARVEKDWTKASGSYFMCALLGVSGYYVTEVHIPVPCEPDREYLITCTDGEITSVVLVDFDLNGNVIAKTEVTKFTFESMTY